ncbi:hypothetical protein [Methyloprofundus sp.]
MITKCINPVGNTAEYALCNDGYHFNAGHIKTVGRGFSPPLNTF